MHDQGLRDRSHESTATLLAELSREMSDLVHEEVQLAKAEMAEKAKRAGVGSSLLVMAGGLAVMAGAVLVAAAVAALSQVLSVWAAALITAGALLVLAGAAGAAARRPLTRAAPLSPKEAIADTKEEVEWLKTQARSARR